jgi:ABC-type multidrug transport system permease subunit
MRDVLPRWVELLELTRHRTLAFIRQPEAVFWVFAFPLVLSAVLGFAFQGREPAPSRVGVVDAEAEWVERLEADPRLEVLRFDTREEADRRLAGGHIDALVLSFEPPELRLDIARAEAELARLRVLVAVGGLSNDQLAIEQVTENGARYIDFLFPGLLGMSLMGTGLWAIGFAVADMRQRKVLKRFLVTPMQRSSFLASFLSSRMIFLAAELAVITAFGVWVLGVPLRTSLIAFLVVCTIGALAFSAIGLLVASRAKTIEGVSGLLNLVMIPMWLGSGVFFSYERFPEQLHPVLQALPLTALNDALRGGMIDGAGLVAVLPQMGVLAVWTIVSFALALRIFRWA